MRCIAVIPARGGSNGIPRKNLVRVAGVPLVEWSIMQACAANLVDDIIVTTDSDDVEELAVRHGCSIVRRDGVDSLSGDNAMTEAAVIHALDTSDIGDRCWVLTMQATSPIRDADCLDLAISQAIDGEERYDSLFSACEVEGYCWRVCGKYSPEPLEAGPRQRRQDRKTKVIEENGSFYLTKAGMLRANRNRLCGRIGYYLMDPLDSFQVDDPSDLARMESLMHVRLPQITARQVARENQRSVGRLVGDLF